MLLGLQACHSPPILILLPPPPNCSWSSYSVTVVTSSRLAELDHLVENVLYLEKVWTEVEVGIPAPSEQLCELIRP